MKKILVCFFTMSLFIGAAGISSAGGLPYNIGYVTEFLNNGNFFNGYVELGAFDFTGEWKYTAIGFESGHINITEESTGLTFTTGDHSNFGNWNNLNFDNDNLYFEDSNGPFDIPLDDYDSSENFFRLFRLTADSRLLSYLSNPVILAAGTYVAGFNDNGSPTSGDSDFDDIIVAMKPTDVAATPEPATMLLLSTGLVGLVGLKNRLGRNSRAAGRA